MTRDRFLLVVTMIFVAALFRIVPHPPNFTPVAALALFGGAVFQDRRWAIAMPLAAMFLSDWIIGFHELAPVIYMAFIAMVFMGTFLNGRRRWRPVAYVATGASVFFFTVSNLGVWAHGVLYPRTLEGLVACYVAALPFFQNTLLGTLFYTFLLFGGLWLLEKGMPRFRETVLAPVR